MGTASAGSGSSGSAASARVVSSSSEISLSESGLRTVTPPTYRLADSEGPRSQISGVLAMPE